LYIKANYYLIYCRACPCFVILISCMAFVLSGSKLRGWGNNNLREV
jgi:hypothetical protein